MDTAARVRSFDRGDRDQVREFLTRYQDRILYATDFSPREGDAAAAARSSRATHELDWAFFAGNDRMTHAGHPTQGLALPQDVLRKIFRENALRWIPGLNARARRSCGRQRIEDVHWGTDAVRCGAAVRYYVGEKVGQAVQPDGPFASGWTA